MEYKEAGGSWTEWLTETSATEGTFHGTIGMTYTFRLKATDNVDNTNASWAESEQVKVEAVRKYYAFGGSKVAMRQGDEVYYLSGDHLGSTSLTTDSNGEKISEVRYLPYGQERWNNGSSVTDFGFTSQRNEASFGLMDYNARYYSPLLGRFISPDSLVPEPTSSGGFNRYRYVRNNPLKYVDPSGHAACGSAEWEQDFSNEHGGRSSNSGDVADCETSRKIGGAETWTDADWNNFHYAQRDGLSDWISSGVNFTGIWKGDQLHIAVTALNEAKNVLGDKINEILGLDKGFTFKGIQGTGGSGGGAIPVINYLEMTMAPSSTMDEILFTMFHEMGHFVHEFGGTANSNKMWVDNVPGWQFDPRGPGRGPTIQV